MSEGNVSECRTDIRQSYFFPLSLAIVNCSCRSIVYSKFSPFPIAAVLLAAIVQPAQALDVTVQPNPAQLGDTLSVTIEMQSDAPTPPTLTIQGQTYPAFPVGTRRYRALLPTTPLDTPGTWAIEVAGDETVKTVGVEIADRDFPIQEIWLAPEVNAIEGTDYEFDLVDAFRALETPEQFWHSPFLDPSSGSMSTAYGVRRYYNGEWAQDYYHRGLDYAAPEGDAVIAAAAGRVSLVGFVANGFELHGNTVGIDHGQGVTTMYLHLSAIEVREGQMVQAGDIIGRVGSTGIATGPHLHWGLYVSGKSVDPIPWLERGFK